ncbi:PTS system [Cutibacterium acnes JCM 18918]|nr:PTS system [Cutibacterium acnes JCM 18918]
MADVTATSQNDLYAQVNDRLTADNMVKSTFLNAVSAREKKFPTGLDFGYVSIAIPHIDPEHVISPGYWYAAIVHRQPSTPWTIPSATSTSSSASGP